MTESRLEMLNMTVYVCFVQHLVNQQQPSSVILSYRIVVA